MAARADVPLQGIALLVLQTSGTAHASRAYASAPPPVNIRKGQTVPDVREWNAIADAPGNLVHAGGAHASTHMHPSLF